MTVYVMPELLSLEDRQAMASELGLPVSFFDLNQLSIVPTESRKGGPGSGNFGHAGRPGEVGGSGEGGGSSALSPVRLSRDDKERISKSNYEDAKRLIESGGPGSIERMERQIEIREQRPAEIEKTRAQWQASVGAAPKDLEEEWELELARLPHQIAGARQAIAEARAKQDAAKTFSSVEPAP